MKKFFLEVVVFICGGVVMAFEIIGSRMLGPYVGTSYFVWSSIIGVILISLSLGYFLGGKLADRKLNFTILAVIIFAAGIFIAVSTLIKDNIINLLFNIITDVKLVSIVASIFLFVLPGFFLGMVSPYAARLKINNLRTTGSIVGNLYAISTIGSITGTFLAGFWLIPNYRISYILYLLSITLFVSAITLYFIFRNSIKRID